MKKLTALEIRKFRRKVWVHYKKEGRIFPWRKTKDPYRILVSEIMLQQTQAGKRTEEKYREFIKEFPTTETLSKAPLSKVLTLWQGLGYNRRAKYLWETAKILESRFKGKIPKKLDDLRELPGIGLYTAQAIRAFAYDIADVFIETNIRTVYIHEFFKGKDSVADRELLPLIMQTLDTKNPREWYFALMDLGATLKKENRGIGKRSAHYVSQKPFKGSDREVRGAILRSLVFEGKCAKKDLIARIPHEKEKTEAQLLKLLSEGMVVRKGARLALP